MKYFSVIFLTILLFGCLSTQNKVSQYNNSISEQNKASISSLKCAISSDNGVLAYMYVYQTLFRQDFKEGPFSSLIFKNNSFYYKARASSECEWFNKKISIEKINSSVQQKTDNKFALSCEPKTVDSSFFETDGKICDLQKYLSKYNSSICSEIREPNQKKDCLGLFN